MFAGKDNKTTWEQWASGLGVIPEIPKGIDKAVKQEEIQKAKDIMSFFLSDDNQEEWRPQKIRGM